MVSIDENAQKIIAVSLVYPENKFTEVLSLFQIPRAEIEAAVWRAVDQGWITVDKKKDSFKVTNIPEFSFGKEIYELEDLIMYVFKKLGQEETDLDDYNFSAWFAGYPSHNLLIAIKRLIANKVIATYQIIDQSKSHGESTYDFYTLSENLDKKWGKKYFKNEAKIVIK